MSFSLFIHLLTTFALFPPSWLYASRCIEYGIHVLLQILLSVILINTQEVENFNEFYVYKGQFVLSLLLIVTSSEKREFLYRSLRFFCCSLLSAPCNPVIQQQELDLFLNEEKLFLCLTILKNAPVLVNFMLLFLDCPALVTVPHENNFVSVLLFSFIGQI